MTDGERAAELLMLRYDKLFDMHNALEADDTTLYWQLARELEELNLEYRQLQDKIRGFNPFPEF